MAGNGPPPKHNRVRRNAPARGEWVTLPAKVSPAVLSLLPERLKRQGKWSKQTRAAWSSWRKDPATSQYGPAEIQSAIDLAYLYEEWARGDTKLSAEIRLRMDGLGLTAKGKRDLRWKMPEPDEGQAKAEAAEDKSPDQRRSEMHAVRAV
jgi:hypothetical protein